MQKDAKAAAKKNAREEKETGHKRLGFLVDDTQTKESEPLLATDAIIVAEEAPQAVTASKRTRFSESEEESSEPSKSRSTASDKSEITQASQREMPSMALTTKRLEDPIEDTAISEPKAPEVQLTVM